MHYRVPPDMEAGGGGAAGDAAYLAAAGEWDAVAEVTPQYRGQQTEKTVVVSALLTVKEAVQLLDTPDMEVYLAQVGPHEQTANVLPEFLASSKLKLLISAHRLQVSARARPTSCPGVRSLLSCLVQKCRPVLPPHLRQSGTQTECYHL